MEGHCHSMVKNKQCVRTCKPSPADIAKKSPKQFCGYKYKDLEQTYKWMNHIIGNFRIILT